MIETMRKTPSDTFVRAIAGDLSWWYIEIIPGMLMADRTERLGANLHSIMGKTRTLEDAVPHYLCQIIGRPYQGEATLSC